MQQHVDAVKGVFDAAAVFVAIGALADILPKVAALFSIVWLGIQIYDRVKYGPRRK